MHFEVPKAKKFKEFGGEYIMIVISILTALALEHGAQSLHHHKLATQAAVNMDVEIADNLKDLTAVLAHNRAKVAELKSMRHKLLADIKAGGSEADMVTRFTTNNDKFGLSVQTPTYRREAWDVAVANQAASWMTAADLRRYSSAYGAMRDMQMLTNGGGLSFINAPAMKDVTSNIQMGVSNPHEIYRMLNQMITAYDSMDGNLESLERQLQAAVKAKQTDDHS